MNMSDIKIFVTHTPNRSSICLKHPFFYNVIAGSKFLQSGMPEGMYSDCTGNNISEKNKSYCELTTQYWAWKNQEADYYGFCHYRRFFSFSGQYMPLSDCGCLIRPGINSEFLTEMGLDAQNMRRQIEENDFLIAEGISTEVLHAKNVYEHYHNAEELHIQDVDILLSIIEEKYPGIWETAKSYFKGKKFYPCNMFIMKKEFFYEYSEMLFDVLAEFEKRADMSSYSREGYRTPGHLGERMAGIYFEYKKKQGDCRLKELQMVMLEHTEKPVCIHASSEENSIPVAFVADQKNIPVLFVCIKSMVENVSKNNDYEIYIFHTDIKKDTQDSFSAECQGENITIHFVDVTAKREEYTRKCKEEISIKNYSCILILDMLKEYDKVLYLDYTLVIKRDIADLYRTDLEDNLAAGALALDIVGKNVKDTVTGLQSGVLLLNVKGIRKKTSAQELIKMANNKKFTHFDWHILDLICEGDVLCLNQAWNFVVDSREKYWNKVIKSVPYYVLDEYETAGKKPYIIHYTGDLPPWRHPSGPVGREFWNVARGTEYYEELVEMIGQKPFRNAEPGKVTNAVKRMAKKVLPPGSKIRSSVINLYLKLRRS